MILPKKSLGIKNEDLCLHCKNYLTDTYLAGYPASAGYQISGSIKAGYPAGRISGKISGLSLV